MESSRTYFRVEYPKSDQPLLVQGDNNHHIINISEKGVLFTFTKVELKEGDLVKGHIIFKDNEKIQIKGRIIRQQDKTAALHLSEGIPLQRIMNEQRILIRKYGTLKRPVIND